jgi:hypothetical protein
MVIDLVDTFLFHTNGTFQTALFPGHHPRLGDRPKTMGFWLRVDDVFRRHGNTPYEASKKRPFFGSLFKIDLSDTLLFFA